MKNVEIEKMSSSLSGLNLGRNIDVIETNPSPRVGDVVAVRSLSESLTYSNPELPTGRLLISISNEKSLVTML